MGAEGSPRLGVAVADDAGRVAALMRSSVLALFPDFYDERQTASAAVQGVPLYRSFGFQEVERAILTLPDGVTIDGVVMERPVDPG